MHKKSTKLQSDSATAFSVSVTISATISFGRRNMSILLLCKFLLRH